MTISTYTELQTAITNWLARSDLSSRIPEFIQLGEAHLNRNIHHPAMLTQATVTTSTSDRYAALPTGYLEIRALVNQDGDSLIQSIPGSVLALSQGADAGEPEYFAISDQFEFDCISDQAYALSCIYRKKLDIAADTTNWLLTKYPDAYLYASLLQAQPFIYNDTRMPMLAEMLRNVIYDINSSSKNRVTLRVDDALLSHGGFDINRGY